MCFNVAFNIIAYLFIFSLFSFSLLVFFCTVSYSIIVFLLFFIALGIFCLIKPFVQFHILYIFTLLKSVGFILIKNNKSILFSFFEGVGNG